jgi:isoamylase
MHPGVAIRKKMIEFTVHSTANQVWLLLFDSADAGQPAREIEMTPSAGHLWHTCVPGAASGSFYLYRTDAVPEQWLLDPRARAFHVPHAWGDASDLTPGRRIHTSGSFPKCIVVDDAFDWHGEKRPRTPMDNTVIYEAHLRGFTAAEGDGTYLGFIEKIPYLKSLGVTAVEFLPLFEFNELEYFLEGGARKNLLNFWGYSTLGFFAPMSRYARSREPGAAVTEFKTLVKALHRAGIEVWLDVVYNHTGEGPFNGQAYHFRELDEAAAYLIHHDGTYANWTGCGNTVNANHPVMTQFIVDSLCYWAEEMHVDGFRFDLAASLCRGANGELLDNPPLIRAIEAAPALKKVKLIAEAWDLDSYLVGDFPGKRFADWNGRFRDDIRLFWNDGKTAGALATRLAGSADLYEKPDGSPLNSINFVTSHDGFTLADLVTFERKHNEANREQNRDGEKHNYSINFGTEGPSDDPVLCARRLKQQKNLLATLFLSRGVPMLTAGDEFGRTQQGNNNAYCQDNELSWIDWSLPEKNRELFEFTQRLIALRSAHPALRKDGFYTGKGDVEWLGPESRAVDWHRDCALGMLLPEKKTALLILINNEPVDLSFDLPDGRWTLELATDPETLAPLRNDETILIPSASVCVLCRGKD